MFPIFRQLSPIIKISIRNFKWCLSKSTYQLDAKLPETYLNINDRNRFFLSEIRHKKT